MKFVYVVFLLLFLPQFALCKKAPSIIPAPTSFKQRSGKFILTDQTVLVSSDPKLLADAAIFAEQVQKLFGLKLQVAANAFTSPAGSVINLEQCLGGPTSSYTLRIEQNAITICGNNSGPFHGLQSLLQLIEKGRVHPYVRCAEIRDQPRFSWRGMHLDVCRHFFPVEFIKRYIDLLALHKMNTFHWHLTDDQGWRIESKTYPLLNTISSRRSGTMTGHYRDQAYDTIPYQGLYTQEEIRDIIQYAAQRHVTVVPEIEMPGHALAALAAYPGFSCTGGPFEVARGWGVFEDVFCAGNDSVFAFLENVLDEVIRLFPGKYIHIGGDECPKTRWKSCPKCQQRMRSQGLADEHALQSYFIRRIEKFVNSRNRQIIGWDEILEGGLAPNAAVMSWRGTEGGLAAAGQDHAVVMCPGSHCYFDHYQGDPATEPLAFGGFTPLEKVYAYEPIPEKLSPDKQQYVLGGQGNVWTEYISTPAKVEYMALPRMCALAEVLWSPPSKKSYRAFIKRLKSHSVLLDRLSVNYCRVELRAGHKN